MWVKVDRKKRASLLSEKQHRLFSIAEIIRVNPFLGYQTKKSVIQTLSVSH